MSFYYKVDGVIFGPVSARRLARLTRTGWLDRDTPVSALSPEHPDFCGWQPLAAIGGLDDAADWQAFTPKPADRLPFLVLGAVVLMFVVYFTQPDLAFYPAQVFTGEGVPATDEEGLELEVCSSLAQRVYVAVAYFDRGLQDWVARGWYPHERDRCRLLMKKLRHPVFVYSESKDGRERWRPAQGEAREFCIDRSEAFVLPQRRCGQMDLVSDESPTEKVFFGALGPAQDRRARWLIRPDDASERPQK